MKWLAFSGEILGFLSSVALAWGFSRPASVATWVGDTATYEKSPKRLRWIAGFGFGALALSFLIQGTVTLFGPD
jgi:hypothetical protein